MKNHLYITYMLILILVCTFENANGQSIKLSLDQTIKMAQEFSLDIFRAKNMYQIKELNYQDYMVELNPHMNFRLTPVDYSRSIIEEYNSDLKKYESVEIQRLTSDYSLNIDQKVGFTGGTINVSSSLMRSQRYGTNSDNNLDFISTPLSVRYYQNFAQINTYKWKAKIEPLRFEQAKLEFIEQREQISVTTVNLFFNLLGAQNNYNIARLNRGNAESLITIGKQRGEIGAISRDDLLNLELSQINAKINEEQAKNNLENARLDLCEFLELPLNTAIKCLAPEQVYLTRINVEQAQLIAEKNNPGSHYLIQNLLEVKQQVKVAKRSRYDISLEVGAGLNQNKQILSEAFQDLLNKQNFRVSLNIPIMNWRETKRHIQRASLNEQLAIKESQKVKDRLQIEVVKITNEFNIKPSELFSAAKADTISQYAYEVTQQRFTQGKVNVISINESYRSMYSARNQYLNALRNYWYYYYAIRKLCLYDFEANIDLKADFDQMIVR